MMEKTEKISSSGIVTITLLFSLVGINAVWLIISAPGGALIAIGFYLIVSYVCLRRRHFRAGVIAGIFGFGIHVYELFAQGATKLMGIDQVCFYANIILPIPLTLTSYLASRKGTSKHVD